MHHDSLRPSFLVAQCTFIATVLLMSSAVISPEEVSAQLTTSDSQSDSPSDTANPRSQSDEYWLAEDLIHGHLALSQSWIDRPTFSLAPTALSSIGAPNFITRHVKGGEEGPWWNTKIPTRFCSPRDLGCQREPAREIVQSWQGQGKKPIAYYRHVWEKSQADADATAAPEDRVVCLDERGQPQVFDKDRDGEGQVFLSLSSRHKETVKQRMIELAEMGFEAVYFDFKHQPEKGCWDFATRNAYRLQTGREVPEPRPDSTFVAELSNPAFRNYLAFNNRQIATAFREWQAAGRSVNPRFTVIISASYMNSLTTPHLSTNMYPKGSLAKTEFRLPTVIGPQDGGPFHRAPAGMPQIEESSRLAFGYSMLRSATFNTPPHVWLHVSRLDTASSTPEKKLYFPPTREELTRGAAAVLGLGGIANIHIDNAVVLSPSLQEEYRATFATTNEWNTILGGKNMAVSHVGVFFSERLRWRDASSADSYWFNSNLPALASFDVLQEQGVPAQVVVDRELSRGLPRHLKALVINEPVEMLTPIQQTQLAAFVARGGQVINGSSRSWTPDAYAASRAWLTTQLAPVIRSSFVRVLFSREATQRTFVTLANRTEGEAGGKILLIPNDFSWVQRLGPDQVTVRSAVRGVSLRFPPSARAPEVVNLTTAPPTQLTAERDGVSGGWSVRVPAFTSDLGLFSIP